MATYKKRGYKKPKEKVQEVVEETLEQEGYVEGESTTEEVFDTLDTTANKAEEWFASNQKPIFAVVGVIALGVLAYMGYGKFIQEPKESEAANDIYKAQTYFKDAIAADGVKKDSLFNLALNGGEGRSGVLDVIDQHGGTAAANMGNYMAGMSYLHTGDYTKAVQYLEQFSSDDAVLSVQAKGALADAFVQLGQLEDAMPYYEQAIQLGKNDYVVPKYLYKAAIIALELGKNDQAITYLNRIKEEYPSATEAAQVDVLLGKAQAGK